MQPCFTPRLVSDLLIGAANRYPNSPAVVAEGHVHDYASLEASSKAIAKALHDLGVNRGDRVAIFAENGIATCTSVFATVLLGAVFTIVNPQTKADKLGYVLDDAGIKAFVTESHLARTFASVLESRKGRFGVICAGPPMPPAEGFAWLEWQKALTTPPWSSPPVGIPLDLAALIYTSGTTGHPKGVMLTHQNLVFTTGSVVEYLEVRSDDRVLNVLPMAFSYGLYQLLACAATGAALHLERSFAFPVKVYERIEKDQITAFPGVPSIYATMVAAHARRPLSFPSVRTITNAAAALPNAHARELRNIFPSARLFKMYGQTECARGCYLDPSLVDVKPDSVGKAIPGTELLVLDPSGAPAPPGEAGILHIRGPHVMAGYWKQPELTDEALKPGPAPGERMLCTRDWFKVDPDGCHYFVARSDDIIKTRGEKVSPTEVENALHTIPGIREAAVIGVPDETHGQAVRAHVVLDPDSTLTDRQIITYCRDLLENFMVPRDVVFETELPKTPSGKVRKLDLVNRG